MENEKNENNSEKEEIIETESTTKPETKTENTKSKKEIKEESIEIKAEKSKETKNTNENKSEETTKSQKQIKKKISKKTLIIIITIILLITVIFICQIFNTPDDNYNFDINTIHNNNNSNSNNQETNKDTIQNNNSQETSKDPTQEIQFSDTIDDFTGNISENLIEKNPENYTKENSPYFYIENNKVYYNYDRNKNKPAQEVDLGDETPKELLTVWSGCSGGFWTILTNEGNVYRNKYSNEDQWAKINTRHVDEIYGINNDHWIGSTCNFPTLIMKSDNKYYYNETEIDFNNLKTLTGQFIITTEGAITNRIYNEDKIQTDNHKIFYDRFDDIFNNYLTYNNQIIKANVIIKQKDNVIIIDNEKNVYKAEFITGNDEYYKTIEIKEIKNSKVKNIQINGTFTSSNKYYFREDFYTKNLNIIINYEDETYEEYKDKKEPSLERLEIYTKNKHYY